MRSSWRKVRPAATTVYSCRCRCAGEHEGVEDGGSWWRLVEVSAATCHRVAFLHHPPPSSTILHHAVEGHHSRHHHLHARRWAARFAATHLRATHRVSRQ